MQTRETLIRLSTAIALVLTSSIAARAGEAWLVVPNQPARTWTPRFRTEAEWQKADSDQKDRGILGNGVRGFRRGGPFKGMLLRLQGLQNIRSHQYAVIKLKDGTTRGWPVRSFSKADQDYCASMVETHVGTDESEANPKRIVEYKDYKKENRGKTYEIFESDYFVLWRGMDKERAGIDAFEPEFTPRVLTYMDQIWCFYRDALGFPMPWSDKKRQAFYHKAEPAFHKINVYLTETGLSKHKKGWANGASAIQIHPRALGGGSSVIVHEMGHVMQLYSGGMQNWSPVGSFWETHANWQTHQFIPSFVGGQKQYFDGLHRDLNWSGHRYNSWLWLQHFYENPRIGPEIPIAVWLENTKEEGKSVEDPIQTFLRMFKERNIYSDDSMAGFGDELANMAARIVTMDYVFQQTYLDARVHGYNKPAPAVPVVQMEKVEGRKGMLRPPESHVPGQYGINIAELEAAAGKVTVSLEKDESRECDPGSWRLTLVAVDKDLAARYSKMTRGTAVSMKAKKGDRVFVAVAAVPKAHKPRDFNDTKGLAQSFPYILTVR